MTKIRALFVCILLLTVCTSSEAQTRRRVRRVKNQTTHVQKTQESPKKDTVIVEPPIEEPQYKSLSDTLVVKYLRGGFVREKKLHLITNADYNSLTREQKQQVLGKVAREFAGYDMTLYTGDQQRELWIADGNSVRCLEQWNNDSLHIENYMPLALKRNGRTKVFYYIGGTFNGSEDYSNGSLNFRGGSYLYKNYLDAALTLNIGYNKTGDEGDFAGDVGLDSRAYLPIRIKKVKLAPYLGAGISWSFAPEQYFEFRASAGACWFVGPGSLDIGVQYGTESNFSGTLGYTFHISTVKKRK